MIWCYDDSYEGFLSAVFAVYRAKDGDAFIQGHFEPQLGLMELRQVETSEEQAERVHQKLEDISEDLSKRMYRAWLSREEQIEQAILAYIRLAVEQNRDPFEQRYLATVSTVLQAEYRVAYDVHRHFQFIRFKRAGDTVYLADIEPQYDILLLLTGMFTDRLDGFRFLIRDIRRGKCLIWDQRHFWLSTDPALLASTPEDTEYERLWQLYFHNVAIPERINPKLQTLLVPKRYRRMMTEFQGCTKIVLH